jgi:hypothetical protein
MLVKPLGQKDLAFRQGKASSNPLSVEFEFSASQMKVMTCGKVKLNR